MKKKYQVTIMCGSGAYKPISTLIEVEQTDDADLTKDKTKKKEIIQRGVNRICATRYWTSKDLTKYGYTTAKVRVYDRLAILQQQKENYEKLKEEKYASGEWKRPKNKASE
jgi:hypothetical protein